MPQVNLRTVYNTAKASSVITHWNPPAVENAVPPTIITTIMNIFAAGGSEIGHDLERRHWPKRTGGVGHPGPGALVLRGRRPPEDLPAPPGDRGHRPRRLRRHLGGVGPGGPPDPPPPAAVQRPVQAVEPLRLPEADPRRTLSPALGGALAPGRRRLHLPGADGLGPRRPAGGRDRESWSARREAGSSSAGRGPGR